MRNLIMTFALFMCVLAATTEPARAALNDCGLSSSDRDAKFAALDSLYPIRDLSVYLARKDLRNYFEVGPSEIRASRLAFMYDLIRQNKVYEAVEEMAKRQPEEPGAEIKN